MLDFTRKILHISYYKLLTKLEESIIQELKAGMRTMSYQVRNINRERSHSYRNGSSGVKKS